MTGWRIRPAVSLDTAQMTDVIFASKASNGYDAAFMEACRDELRVTPESLDDGYHWVAADRDTILGTISLSVETADTGTINALFVAPDLQGAGVGRALWQVAIAKAQTLSLATLRLDADPEAVAFYQAMGGTVVGQVPSGSIAGRMLPLMEFRL